MVWSRQPQLVWATAAAAGLVVVVAGFRRGARRCFKLVYKPMGMVVSVLGGFGCQRGPLQAGVEARQWVRTETPTATQRHRTWSEILVAALPQGAIFGLVKAAVDRAGAAGFERATGAWPGDE